MKFAFSEPGCQCGQCGNDLGVGVTPGGTTLSCPCGDPTVVCFRALEGGLEHLLPGGERRCHGVGWGWGCGVPGTALCMTLQNYTPESRPLSSGHSRRSQRWDVAGWRLNPGLTGTLNPTVASIGPRPEPGKSRQKLPGIRPFSRQLPGGSRGRAPSPGVLLGLLSPRS